MPTASTQGSSMGSSAMSAGSETGTQKGKAHFYTEKIPLFPMLHQMAVDWHPRMTFLVAFIHGLQLIGFVINTIDDSEGHSWGPTMEIVRKVLFFTHFPIWEPTFIADKNRVIACMVVFWMIVVLIGTLGAVLGMVYRDRGQGQVPTSLVKFCKHTLHSVGGFGFFPIANMLLSFMVCADTNGGRRLRAYPDRDCWSSWHMVHFVSAILTFALLLIFAYMVNVMLFSIVPNNPMVNLARAHSQFDEMFLFFRVALVVLFHIIISRGSPDTGETLLLSFFAWLLCGVSVFCAVVLSVQLPFYSLAVTRCHVAAFSCVAWNAFLAALKPFLGSGFSDGGNATIAFGVGSIAAAILGYYVSDYRVARLERSFQKVMKTGDFGELTALSSKAEWPANLPESDLELCRCSYHAEAMAADDQDETENQDDTRDAENPSSMSSRQQVLEVVGSYLDAILLPTDVEVSTRMLRSFVLQCQRPCSPAMLSFSARLYTKGIVKFPSESVVHLHLISFLTYFAGGVGVPGMQHSVVRIRAALSESESLMASGASLVSLYQTYLLQILMKPLIGMTNDSHRKIVAAALKTYKDILGQMAMFWNKLLVSENVNTMQLAVIANSVTGRRGEGLDLFQKALQHPTFSLVRKYAQFLRQVMIDEDSAHTIEQKLTHMQREEKNGQQGQSAAPSMSQVFSMGDFDTDLTNNKAGNSGMEGFPDSQKGSSTIRRLALTMNLMFSLVVVVLIGFFVLEATLSSARLRFVEQIEAAGEARALALQCAVLVQRVVYQRRAVSSNTQEVSPTRDDLKAKSERFLTLHYELTHGSLRSGYQPHEDYFKKNSVEMIDQLRFDDNGGVGASVRTLVPLWVLGNQYGNALLSIANYGATTEGGGTSNTLRQSDVEFVLRNAQATLGPALNRSIAFYQQSHADNEGLYTWILAGLFAMSLLLVFFVYLTMVINFQKVGTSKLDTLNLFTYIPHVHVKMLAEEAKTRLANCEDERENECELFPAGKDPSEVPEGEMATSGSINSPETKLTEGKVAKLTSAQGDQTKDDAQDNNEYSQEGDEEAEDNASKLEATDKDRKPSPPDKKGWLSHLFADVHWSTVSFLLCASVLLIMLVTCILLLVTMRDEVRNKVDTFWDAEHELESINEYSHQITDMSRSARLFQATGEPYFLEAYWRFATEQRLEASHKLAVVHLAKRDITPLFLKVATMLDNIIKQQHIAIALVTRAYYGINASDNMYLLDFVSDFRWNETNLDGGQVMHRGQSLRAPSRPPTTWQEDMNKTAEEQLEIAQSLLYSDAYFYDLREAVTALYDASGLHQTGFLRIDANLTLFWAVMWLGIAQFFMCFALCFAVYFHETLSKLHSFRFLVMFNAMCIAICTALVVWMMTDWQEAADRSYERSQLVELRNQTLSSVADAGEQAQLYVQTGDPRYLDQYLQALRSLQLDRVINTALEIDGDINFDTLSDGYGLLNFLRRMERVALTRAAIASDYKIQANDSEDLQRLLQADYDITRQGRLYIEQVMFYPTWTAVERLEAHDAPPDKHTPATSSHARSARALGSSPSHTQAAPEKASFHQHQIYSSSAEDALKTKEEQLLIARHTVFSVAYESFLHRAQQTFLEILDGLEDEVDFRLHSALSSIENMILIAVVLELTVLGLLSLYGVFHLVRFLNLSDSQTADFFPTLMRNCRLSLALLAVLICVTYGITFLNKTNTENVVNHANSVSKREWLVAQSMFLSQELLGTDGEGGGLGRHEQLIIRSKLDISLQDISDNRAQLAGITGHSSQLDALNFGATTEAQGKLMVAGEVVSTCSPVQRDPLTTPLLSILANDMGLELGVLTWSGTLQQLSNLFDLQHTHASQFSARQSVKFTTATRKLWEGQLSLFAESMQATKVQIKYAKDTISDASLLLFLLLALVVFFTVFVYLFVFRSMVSLLKNEEEGTKLMLTMIPQDVRETAPAIAEYLSTGVITLNHKIEEANEWIVEYSAVPAIVIDHIGSIQRFSRAARETFGYEMEEVMGKNIKMLMPEEYSNKHDEFLAAYRKTGIRRIIGKGGRKARAMQKNGNEFHAKILVHELKKTGRDPIFIGTVQDITADLALERQLLVGETVVKYSHTPIIILNTVGTVVSLSLSAQQKFGLKPGSDVKQIMMDDIAAEHDIYLERYLKTGKKSVIGKLLKVEALLAGITGGMTSTMHSQATSRGTARSENLFSDTHMSDDDDHIMQGELQVNEYCDEDGSVEGFMGYLRDLTEENQVRYACAVSESIMKVSPNPVVSIDQVGSINRWNRQAEVSFGLKQQDALGQNVKIIVPPEVAPHHDGYLARYLRTGEKKMINATRKVEAKRANGDLFPCEVGIREVGTSYIAYIRETVQEEILFEAVDLQQKTMDKTSSAVIIINEKGIVSGFNPAAEALFRYTKAEIINLNIDMLMPDEIARQHASHLARYLSTGKKYVIDQRREVSGKRKDGVLLILETYVMEVFLSANERLYVGTITDITERKRIARQNRVNSQIIKMIASPIVTMDDVGQITLFNEAAESLFGWASADIIGRNVSLLQPDTVAAKHDLYLSEYKATGKKNIIDSPRVIKARRKNGSMFAAEILVKVIKVTGAGSTFMASFRDTSFDRKQSDLRARIQTVMQNEQFMFVSINSSGKVLSFNKCAEKTLQYTEEELKDKNIKIVLPDEIARNHDSFIRSYLRTGIKRVIDKTIQNSIKRRDQSLIPVDLQVKEIRQGSTVTFIAYIRDKLASQAAELNTLLKNTLINRCPTPLITTDVYGTILTWPPSAEKDTQWSSTEVLGKNIKVIQPPKIAKMHDNYLKEYRKTGKKTAMDSCCEVMVRRKDKTYYHAELSLREIDGDEPKEKFYVGSIQSIATKKEMNKKEKQGKLLLDLAIGGFVAITLNGTITLWNKAAENLWGYTAEETQDQNVRMLMPEPHQSAHDGYLAQYQKTHVKKIIDTTRTLTALRKSGDTLVVSLSVKEISSEGQTIYLGQVVDATNELQSMKDQKVAEVVHSLSPTPIVTINEVGTILTINKSMERTFNYAESELIGQNVAMLVPDDIAIFHDGYLERYKVTKERRIVGSSRDLKAKRKGRDLFSARISVSEVLVAGTTIFVGSILDIDQEVAFKSEIQKTCHVMDLNTLGIVTMHIDGLMTRINESALQTFGYSVEECIGKNVKMLMPKHIADNHDSFLEHYQKTGVRRILDTKRSLIGRKKDGTEFVCEVSVKELKIQNAAKKTLPSVYIGYLRDQTQEERFKEAFEVCNIIAQLSTAPVVSVDVNGRVLKFTPAAEDCWGWSAAEVLSEKVEMLMPASVAANHQGYINSYLKTRKKKIIDKALRTQALKKGGDLISVMITIREVPGNEYFQPTFIAFIEDLTTKDKNALTIKMNKILVDTSIVPIIKMGTKGIITEINDSAKQMFGYPDEKLTGENIKRLVGAEHRDAHDSYLKAYLTTGVKKVIDTTRIVKAAHKSGEEFDVMIQVREVKMVMQSAQYIGYIQPCDMKLKYERAQHKNRVILEIIDTPVLVVNEHGIVVKMSHPAEAALGFSESELVGSNVKKIMPPDIAETHDSKIKTYLQTRRRVMVGARTTVTAQAKSGYLFPAVVNVNQIDTEHGLYFVGMIKPND